MLFLVGNLEMNYETFFLDDIFLGDNKEKLSNAVTQHHGFLISDICFVV